MARNSRLPFNKACEIEDFSHPDLVGVIREVCRHKLPYFDPDYPSGAEYNKDWEVSMAVRALREFGALNRDAVILGVAAGKEDTIFYLTNHVKQVFATDRYLNSMAWKPFAPAAMLTDPSAIAPFGFEPNRLVVQHMDARRLQFPDNTFDAIFSSGSIEHSGELDEIAASAYEVGRVLKPGGIASISTVIKVRGPSDGYGWPGDMVVMSKGQLLHFVVEASGLDLVDELDTEVSAATMATTRNLAQVLSDREARLRQLGEMSRAFDTVYWDMPHILLQHKGYLFNSIHLALRKPKNPGPPATWAKPFPAIDESIRRYNDEILTGGVAVETPLSLAAQITHTLGEVRFFHDRLTRIVARETEENLSKHPPLPDVSFPITWIACPIRVKSGVEFDVIVDSLESDPVSELYRAGHGQAVHQDLIELMLQFLHPGEGMVDLGGFIGTFALAASATGCVACAVEANPANAALIRASAVRNGFRDLRVIEAAATDSVGILNFHSNGPWGRVVDGDRPEETTPVMGLPVDSIISELNWDRVGFVKIDVEGSEIDALEGMRRILTPKDAPALIVESNGHTLALRSSSPQRLAGRLNGLGYRPYLIKPGRLIEVDPRQIQANTVSDWLAVKGDAPSLPGYRVEPPMAVEELITLLELEGSLPTEDQRAYVAGALAKASREIRSDRRIVQLLTGLRSDEAAAVRRNAGWSASEEG